MFVIYIDKARFTVHIIYMESEEQKAMVLIQR